MNSTRLLRVNFVDGSNFGDYLFSYMLRKWNIPFTRVDHRQEYKVISTGSIAGIASKPHTHVWGSGVMVRHHTVDPDAIYHLVRGKITREKTGISDLPIGDPALALPRFYTPSSFEKIHKIGIIPHQIHYDKVAKEVKDKGLNFEIIDPTMINDNWVDGYIDKVVSCEKIISTTLHGLIAAHAYGVPATPYYYDNGLVGDGVKFEDYYTVWDDNYPKDFMYSGPIEEAEDKATYWCPNNEKLELIIDSIISTCPFMKDDFELDDRYYVEEIIL